MWETVFPCVWSHACVRMRVFVCVSAWPLSYAESWAGPLLWPLLSYTHLNKCPLKVELPALGWPGKASRPLAQPAPHLLTCPHLPSPPASSHRPLLLAGSNPPPALPIQVPGLSLEPSREPVREAPPPRSAGGISLAPTGSVLSALLT